MAPSITTLVLARSLPFLRFPLLLNNIIGIPVAMLVGRSIAVLVFIILSMVVAVIDISYSCYKVTQSRRVPVEQSKIHVNALRISADAGMSVGLLITWIIAMTTTFGSSRQGSAIAVFIAFLAWLSHTTSLLAQLYFWTWTVRKTHVCQHCGHRPESPTPIDTPRSVDSLDVRGRDSDETCYNDNECVEDAALLKDDEEA